MSTRSMLGVVIVLMPMAVVSAQMVTFDEPGYLAGSLPPSPWLEEWGKTSYWGVGAGMGVGGTQALWVDHATGALTVVAYELPTPLTSSMGAQRISILFDPGAPLSDSMGNYLTYGGLQVGHGSYVLDTRVFLGVVFRKQGPSNYAIYGPGNYPGTYMGSFAPSAGPNWYEIAFDINAAWNAMTLSVGPVGSSPVSQSFAWTGGPITRVWPVQGDQAYIGQPAIYDNLMITPEPSTLGLLAIGGLALIRRRRT